MDARLVAAVFAVVWAGCGSEVTRGGAGADAAAEAAADGPTRETSFDAEDGAGEDATGDAADVAAEAEAGDALVCPSRAQTACGADCVYVSFHPYHCGACGRRCPSGATCNAGQCRCSGTMCGDVCVSLASDAAHCGACGRACAEGHICLDGACGCAIAECGGRCVDTQTDGAHCGACGRACAATERCDAGTCVCTTPGRGSCGASACGTDLRADAANCGACGEPCAAGQRCDGRCVTVCPRGATDCDRDPAGVCEVFLAADDANCAACGRACSAGHRCIAGRCRPTWVTHRMPGSATVATSARPWFRWSLSGGADGARVEVCADRGCSRVEWRADVRGTSARPESPFAPGVHFWRTFPRRGATLEAEMSPTWEFIVPGAGVTWNLSSNGLMDLDGDGLEDRVVTDASTPEVLRVTYGGGARADTTHRLPRARDLRLAITGYGAGVPFAAGDLDGDGFGDLVTWHGTVTRYSTAGFAPGEMHVIVYGSGDGLTDRIAVFGTGPRFGGAGRSELMGVGALGGYVGGYLGDVAIATRVGGVTGSCTADLTATVRDDVGASWSGLCDAAGFAAGDYDADGRVDVVVWPGASAFTAGEAPVPLGRCEAFRSPLSGDRVRAADVDGDGFDDLVRTGTGGGAVLYGGRGGLDGSRCAALP